MAFVNDRKNLYTIDHERNAILNQTGGIPYGPDQFEFTWNGTVYKFLAEEKTNDEGGGRFSMHWTLLNHSDYTLDYGDLSPADRQMLLQLIEEAFQERGFIFRKEEVTAVTVDCSRVQAPAPTPSHTRG